MTPELIAILLPFILECIEKRGEDKARLNFSKGVGLWAVRRKLRREGYKGRRLNDAVRAVKAEWQDMDEDDFDALVVDAQQFSEAKEEQA